MLFAGDLLFSGGTPFLLMGSVTGAIEVQDIAVRAQAAGIGPLEAARHSDLGPSATCIGPGVSWPPRSGDMVSYNGGRPLTSLD